MSPASHVMKHSAAQLRQETATRWYVRLQNPQLPPSERIDFRRWLDSDPANGDAFHAVELLWQKLGTPAQHLAGSGWHRRRTRRRWLRNSLLGVASLLGLVLFALFWRDPGLWQRYSADLSSAPGSQREISLGDGSKLVLDVDSAVDAQFSTHERRITLLRGRAWFDVQPDGRPFVVESGAIVSRSQNSTFAVDASNRETRVTVSRGQVDVRGASGGAVQLLANQQAKLDSAGLHGPLLADSDRALSWRQGVLIFDQTRLSDVLTSLQRMGLPPVLLQDQELHQQRLSGIFRTDAPHTLLDALNNRLGLKHTDMGVLVVLHR